MAARPVPGDPGTVERRGGRGRNLYEIAAELRLAADLFARDPAGGHPALANFPRAEPAARTPEVYRAVADHVEHWAAPFDREALFGTPLTAHELALRFPGCVSSW